MSSFGLPPDSSKSVLIRVKRRADEEVSTPNKRFKFLTTSSSANNEHIYDLVSKACPTLPITCEPQNKLEIQDYEEWSVEQNKTKDVITCNGQPLELVTDQTNDSLDYLYDIYVYDDNQVLDIEDSSQYRECDDSDEDSNDENYAYNDYPDEDEVSDEVIDYYHYSDLNQDFSRNNIDSDSSLCGDDEDAMDRYLRPKQVKESTEGDSETSDTED